MTNIEVALFIVIQLISYRFSITLLLSIILCIQSMIMRNRWMLLMLFFLSGTCTQSMANTIDFSDMKTHYLTIRDSMRLAYLDKGEGPAVIFVHGLGSNKEAWRKTIPALGEEYRCIALDLPGYGESDKGAYPQTMSFFSDCILEFAEALELEKFHLAGHSMGGQIALYTAIHFPAALRSLVLMAPAGIETFNAGDREFFRSVFNAQVIKSFDEARVRLNFKANFYEMPSDAEFMVDKRLEMMEDSAAYSYYAEMVPLCVQGMLKDTVFQNLHKIKLPVLIVYGKEDALIPNTYLHPELSTEHLARTAQEGIEGSELRLIDEAGHFVHWEQSEKVNPIVKSFLD